MHPLSERLRVSTWGRSVADDLNRWTAERRQAADELDRLTAENARLREALKPFAEIAGPLKGEIGRPTGLEIIIGCDDTEELAVTTIFKTGGAGAVLWADDFRAARQALEQS